MKLIFAAFVPAQATHRPVEIEVTYDHGLAYSQNQRQEFTYYIEVSTAGLPGWMPRHKMGRSLSDFRDAASGEEQFPQKSVILGKKSELKSYVLFLR